MKGRFPLGRKVQMEKGHSRCKGPGLKRVLCVIDAEGKSL